MNTSIITNKQIWISVFYRGYYKTFGKIVIGSSLFLPVYDYCNNLMTNPFLAALISSTFTTIVIHQIDYLKTRRIYGLP